MAFILGVISFLSVGIVIYMTYRTAGDTRQGYGFTGLLAALFSLIGLILGVSTLQERENYRIFPVLGTILDLVVLIGLGLLVAWGRSM